MAPCTPHFEKATEFFAIGGLSHEVSSKPHDWWRAGYSVSQKFNKVHPEAAKELRTAQDRTYSSSQLQPALGRNTDTTEYRRVGASSSAVTAVYVAEDLADNEIDDRAAGTGYHPVGLERSASFNDVEVATGSGEYYRGKRYKKLAQLLSRPLVQRPITRFRHGTLALVAAILATHIAVFAILYSLIEAQGAGVEDLNNAGLAIKTTLDLQRATRYLTIILQGDATANPSGLDTLQPTAFNLAATVAYLQTRLATAINHHRVFYLGGRRQRALPTDYGLGQLWGQDSVTATVWYDLPVSHLPPGANITAVVTRDNIASGMYIRLANSSLLQLVSRQLNMSMWNYGNLIFSNADEVIRLAANVSASGRVLDSWPPVRFLLTTDNVFNFALAYASTMDAMMQLVAVRAETLAKAMLVVMGMHGVLLALMVILVFSGLATYVAEQRYLIYYLFMTVPGGLIRMLATRKLDLEAKADDDDDYNVDGTDMPAPPPLEGGIGGGPASWQMSTRDMQADMGAKTGPLLKSQSEHNTDHLPMLGSSAWLSREQSWLMRWLERVVSPLLIHLMPWRALSQGIPRSKRQLVRSAHQTVYLTWPFLVWGLVIIVLHIMTFISLQAINTPIAISNSVKYVSVVHKALLFTWQELFLTKSVLAAAQLRGAVRVIHGMLTLEYNTLVFGAAAAGANMSLPRYAHSQRGLVHVGGQGLELLLESTGCLRANRSTCLTTSSPYYGDATSGIDRWMRKLLSYNDALMMMSGIQPGMGSNIAEWAWQTNPDCASGMDRLNAIYETMVVDVISNVLDFQIASFALTWVIMALFLLFVFRPFLNRVKNETKRVAELLSQLPAEVDVEGLVQRWLMGATTNVRASQPLANIVSNTTHTASATKRSPKRLQE